MKRKRTADSIIRAAQVRAGYYRETDKLCGILRIAPRTYAYRMSNIGSMKLSELRRMIAVLHLTDEELIDIVRG